MEALKQLLTDIIRPIVMEALREAITEVKTNPTKRYYTAEEAWEHLRVSRATFYRRVAKGQIEILKIGARTLVDADRLDDAIEKKEIYRYKH